MVVAEKGIAGMGSHRLLSLLSIALMAVACNDSGSSHFSASVVDIGGEIGRAHV